MPRTVFELTSAIASGDTEALALLYRERFDGLYAEARRCTGRDESFCLDVVQDAMLKVIRSMKPLHEEHQLTAWLRVVVQRCAYDCLRAERRLKRRERNAAMIETADAVNALDDRLPWLEQQLQTLNADQTQLLNLRFRVGSTLQQIAAALGLKPGAVDGRINRTLSALRRAALEEFHD